MVGIKPKTGGLLARDPGKATKRERAVLAFGTLILIHQICGRLWSAAPT
jgi:hypothetical protein